MNIDYKKEKIEEFIRSVQENLDDDNDDDIDYIYSNIINIKQPKKEEIVDNTIFNYIYVLSKVVIYTLFYDNY